MYVCLDNEIALNGFIVLSVVMINFLTCSSVNKYFGRWNHCFDKSIYSAYHQG